MSTEFSFPFANKDISSAPKRDENSILILTIDSCHTSDVHSPVYQGLSSINPSASTLGTLRNRGPSHKDPTTTKYRFRSGIRCLWQWGYQNGNSKKEHVGIQCVCVTLKSRGRRHPCLYSPVSLGVWWLGGGKLRGV